MRNSQRTRVASAYMQSATSRNRYALVGYVVWRGAKWYLRRRLPSRRALALGAGGALTSAAGAVALAKRLAA
jgi:hypothetical protein